MPGPIFAAILPILTGAAAVATVVGTVGSINAQKDQARIADEQRALDRRKSSISNIKAAQAARARALVTAQGTGAGGSSGAAGGIGAIGSNLGAAFGYASQQGQLQDEFTQLNSQIANFNALTNLGVAGFKFGANRGGLSGLFGSTAPAPTRPPYQSLDYTKWQTGPN